MSCSVCLDRKYNIICPGCGEPLLVKKSILHCMKMYEFGRATCPDCKTDLNLTYLPEEDAMSVRKYDEFRTEKGCKNERNN